MNVTELLASFESKRILVIGDTVVDIATHLERIKDDDTGKPTYRTILDERRKADRYSLGGAALVVRNLLELGAKVDFITAFGYGTGALATMGWSHPNLTLHAIQVGKPQTVKHRFWCDGEKVMQVDTVDNRTTFEPLVQDTTPFIECDGVVVADYRHGLISEHAAKGLVVSANNLVKPLYVSSQVSQSGSNHKWYNGANFILNEREEELAMSLGEFGQLFGGEVITTLGRNGARRMGDFNFYPAITISAVDTCGAGDAFLAAYCLTNDLKFANTWAGLSVTVQGANPPTKQMLLDWCAIDMPTPKYEAMAFCG